LPFNIYYYPEILKYLSPYFYHLSGYDTTRKQIQIITHLKYIVWNARTIMLNIIINIIYNIMYFKNVRYSSCRIKMYIYLYFKLLKEENYTNNVYFKI